MAGTRSSGRLRSSQSSPSQPSSREKQSSHKRKASNSEASPGSKGGHDGKVQKTLEDSIPDEQLDKAASQAEKGSGQPSTNDSKSNGHINKQEGDTEAKTDGEQKPAEINESGGIQAPPNRSEQERAGPSADDGAVQSSQTRADKMPSNVLEKGIVYFFARGRVGVESPGDVQDLARSYIVLRPLPDGAKLTEGPIQDLGNNRLLALPKKVLPKSHRDTFMVFVEKAMTSLKDLRDNFMSASDYQTKTTGTSHTPAMTPIAEGVYAVTTQGRNSHLAYMLTLPSELGQVQESIGLKAKGSFILSVKNPDQKGPANASLPQKPDFPKDIMDGFQGRRWMPLQPQHLDYANAQFLFIGDGFGEFGKAVEKTERDEQNDNASPEEEVEHLEAEDASRAQSLGGDDSVFDDLGLSHKDYPKFKTTW